MNYAFFFFSENKVTFIAWIITISDLIQYARMKWAYSPWQTNDSFSIHTSCVFGFGMMSISEN